MPTRDQQLQQLLEDQSEQIERVFMQHRIPTRVSGGEIREPWIRFDLQTHLVAGRERIESLRQDLMAALGAAVVTINGEARDWQLAIRADAPVPVSLNTIMAELPDLPPVTAVLGLADDDRPLLLDLTSENACHALIAGKSGSGKTSLLRTAALSLAQCNKQSQLQMLIIDGDAIRDGHDATPFRALEHLPHMLNPVIELADDPAAALAFIDGELAYRLENKINTPAIVALIDNVNAVIGATNGGGLRPLTRIAQDGVRAGVHLLLATPNPGDGALDSLFRANIPVRLVGQVDDEREAWAATDRADSRAEYLEGKGDFIAVAAEVMTRFQAAYVRPAEQARLLQRLYRSGRPAILAQPAGGEEDVPLAGLFESNPQGQGFVIDGSGGSVSFTVGATEAAIEVGGFDETSEAGKRATLAVTAVETNSAPQAQTRHVMPEPRYEVEAASGGSMPAVGPTLDGPPTVNVEKPVSTFKSEAAPKTKAAPKSGAVPRIDASPRGKEVVDNLTGEVSDRPVVKVAAPTAGPGVGKPLRVVSKQAAPAAAPVSGGKSPPPRPLVHRGAPGRRVFAPAAVEEPPEPDVINDLVYEDLDEEIPFE